MPENSIFEIHSAVPNNPQAFRTEAQGQIMERIITDMEKEFASLN